MISITHYKVTLYLVRRKSRSQDEEKEKPNSAETAAEAEVGKAEKREKIF